MKRRYKLRENVKIRLQGICLLLLAYACHMVGADGMTVFAGLLGILMAFPFGKVVDVVYHMAKAVVYKYENNLGGKRND